MKANLWTHAQVVALLTSLNIHSDRIRQALLEDRKSGLIIALDLLSKDLTHQQQQHQSQSNGSAGDGEKAGVGDGVEKVSTARIKAKLAHLWRYGGADDSKSVDDLYKYGAWTRTLPSVEALYPGVLEDVKREVKVRQRALENGAPESQQTPKRNSSRKQQAQGHGPKRHKADGESIDCICGFTHYAGRCVQCDQCDSWQHIYCSYGAEEAIVSETHVCKACEEGRPDDTEPADEQNDNVDEVEDEATSTTESEVEMGEAPPLPDAVLAEESLEPEHEQKVAAPEPEEVMVVPQSQTDQKTSETTRSSPLKRARSTSHEECDDLLWGPRDGKIEHIFDWASYRIRTVAASMLDPEASFTMPSPGTLASNEDLWTIALKCFGVDVGNMEDVSPSLLAPVDVLRALMAAAITQWTLCRDTGNTSSMVFQVLGSYQQLISTNYGYEELKKLHRSAWSRLVNGSAGMLRKTTSDEAEQLASRLLFTLTPVVSSIADGAHPTEASDIRYDLLTNIFDMMLNLKVTLPMTDHCYETYTPVAGTIFDPRSMTTETGNLTGREAEEEQIVQLCIMPALIEHPSDVQEGEAGDTNGLFGFHNFITTSDADRARGRMVYRAIVMLKDRSVRTSVIRPSRWKVHDRSILQSSPM